MQRRAARGFKHRPLGMLGVSDSSWLSGAARVSLWVLGCRPMTGVEYWWKCKHMHCEPAVDPCGWRATCRRRTFLSCPLPARAHPDRLVLTFHHTCATPPNILTLKLQSVHASIRGVNGKMPKHFMQAQQQAT